jgi:hypothetical protein
LAESLDYSDFSAAVDTSLARQALERLLIDDEDDDAGASSASDSDGYFSFLIALHLALLRVTWEKKSVVLWSSWSGLSRIKPLALARRGGIGIVRDLIN